MCGATSSELNDDVVMVFDCSAVIEPGPLVLLTKDAISGSKDQCSGGVNSQACKVEG